MDTHNTNTLWMLTKQEKKMRSYWIIALIIQLISSLFLCGALFLLQKTNQMAVMLSLITMISMFVSYLFYHCVYKKHGLIWVTLYLITNPLSILKVIFFDLREAKHPFMVGALLFSIIAQSLLYVLSIYLRKINKKIALKTLETDEYKEALTLLHSSEKIEDLKTRFYTSTQGKPPLFLKQLKKAYKLKKASLNS